MSKIEYKATYQVMQYRPEFLDWYGKKQAKLLMEIQRIDDEMAHAEIEARYRNMFLPSLPSLLIPLGAIVGAFIGLPIVGLL